MKQEELKNTYDGKLDYQAIESQCFFLKGKVLTVIDASIADKQQGKAVKDLIHQQFNEQLDWIHHLCFGKAARGTAQPDGDID